MYILQKERRNVCKNSKKEMNEIFQNNIKNKKIKTEWENLMILKFWLLVQIFDRDKIL